MDALMQLWASTGLSNFQADQAVMMAVGFGLLYLAIKKEFEPLLLLPVLPKRAVCYRIFTSASNRVSFPC